jgi:hypothetical protein
MKQNLKQRLMKKQQQKEVEVLEEVESSLMRFELEVLEEAEED